MARVRTRATKERRAQHYQEHKEELKRLSYEYYQKHKEERLAKDKVYRLNRDFNLTQTEYDALSVSQGNVCAICGNPENKIDRYRGTTARLAVDHNHETGKIRGLLCANCNLALGLFKDDGIRLQRAIQYLKKGA